MVFWFTGLPCSGKTTLALNLVEQFRIKNLKVEHLDGDVVRKFYPDLGFSKKDRNLHITLISMLSSMLERNGVVVVASFVSPYIASRDFAREHCKDFFEIYLSTSLEICEQRDVKGMYRKARAGEIKSFTGVDDVYEAPSNPELLIDTKNRSVEDCINEILSNASVKDALSRGV